MLARRWKISILLTLSHILLSCSGSGGGSSNTTENSTSTQGRSFRMGFSPWPWDATTAAIDWTWSHILDQGDVVSFHIEEGVPWNESLNGTAFSTDYQNKLNGMLSQVPVQKPILLQLNALNTDRNGLAAFRGQGINETLTAPWSGYSLNHTNVKAAYANYVQRMVNLINPRWVLIGIESNLFMRNKKSEWSQYVDLMCSTKNTLRSRGITQPIYVSLFSVPFFPQWSGQDNLADQQQVLADLNSCVDGFAISTHPFMSGLLAESFPDNYFSTLFSFSNKWVGISESSYPAQVWSLSGNTWNGSPEKQRNFLQKMLEASQTQGLHFVIWFSIRDYDQLWNGALGQDPYALVWRDTGLYDETGQARSGLSTWGSEFLKTPEF